MLLGVHRPPPRGVVAAAAAVALATAQPVEAGLFDVDFDLNPAPGAENALRDRSRLPAQICGIIAAYIGCVVIVGVALLTYGRKMRRQINEKIDMVKVNEANGFEMTPVSPSMSMRRWWPRSPSKLSHAFQRSRTSLNQISLPTSPISPGEESMASFDKNFLRDQQEARQREMDRLYAAVMEHDERKNSVRVSQMTAEEPEPREDVMLPAPPSYLSPQQKVDRRPPPLNTHAAALQSRPVQQIQQMQHPPPPSPLSPVRAIYPPESPMAAARRAPYSTPYNAPVAPAPAPAPSHYYSNSHASANSTAAAAPPPPASPRSFMSRARTPSTSSTATKSKKRRSIRNLRISSPIARFSHAGEGQGDDDIEARTPLSPRFYNPGPPPQPPTPASAAAASTAPTTPSTADAAGPFRYEFDPGLQHHPYPPLAPMPLPRPAPQRAVSGASAYAGARASSGSLGLPPSPSPASANAPPLPPSPATTPGPHSHGNTGFLASPPPARSAGAASRAGSTSARSANSANSAGTRTATAPTSLPLRAMAASGPLSPSLHPPTPTKTTVLTSRRGDPRLDRLRSPGTAGPATPYSPYMPFSPVTPVTPHLVTKGERKAREKREKKAVIDEDVEVGVDWGSGW